MACIRIPAEQDLDNWDIGRESLRFGTKTLQLSSSHGSTLAVNVAVDVNVIVAASNRQVLPSQASHLSSEYTAKTSTPRFKCILSDAFSQN